MIKTKHIFHNNTSIEGNGIDYLTNNKKAGEIMVISCGDLNEEPTAISATIDFYGKTSGSKEYIKIKAIKSSDYSIVEEGTIDEAYLIDLTAYESIRVYLSDVSGGDVTVIGEVVE